MDSLLLTAFVAAVTLPALVSSHATPCNVGNDTYCVIGVREEFERTDYWFGDDYFTECPHGNTLGDFYCANPDTENKTIASRMLRGLQYDVNDITQFLHMRWHTPRGHYVACNHLFEVEPYTMSIDLDNTHTIYTDMWILGHQPSLTFTPEDDVYYTVVAYDAGTFMLGGVWSNIVGGDLAFGQVVYPYLGPVGALYKKRNPYVFALFAQTGIVNVEYEKMMIVESIKRNNGIYYLDELITSSGLQGPVGIGYVVIKADAYGIERYAQHNIFNNCPFLVSEKEDLLYALEGMGYNLTGTSYSDYRRTYLNTLEVDVRVTFYNPEAKFMSCCEEVTKHYHAQTVDPLSMEPINAFCAKDRPEIILSPIELRMPPPASDELYTLYLVDVTEVNGTKAENIIKWQVANIRVGDASSGDEVLPYQPPMVYERNETRTYVIVVISQPGEVQTNSLWVYTEGESESCPADDFQRCGFDLGGLITGTHSRLVGVSMFHVQQDPFTRAVMYGDAKALTLLGHLDPNAMIWDKDEVCRGIEGYADPCPAPCGHDDDKP